MDRLKTRLPAVAPPPWFKLIELPVYQPPAFFWWWFRLRRLLAGLNFVEGTYLAASGGNAAIVAAVAMSVWRARRSIRSRRTGLRAGLQPVWSTAPACSTSIAFCSAAGAVRISAVTAPNMCCASRRREVAVGVGYVVPTLVI
jgi:type IV secretion system protein VirD4